MSGFRFPKSRRIIQSADFRTILSKPLYRLSVRTAVLLAVSSITSYPRLGVVVSKRNFPRSCDRNLLKRLVRESFRKKQDELKSFDFIIIAKRESEIDKCKFYHQLEQLWARFQKLCEKQSSLLSDSTKS